MNLQLPSTVNKTLLLLRNECPVCTGKPRSVQNRVRRVTKVMKKEYHYMSDQTFRSERERNLTQGRVLRTRRQDTE